MPLVNLKRTTEFDVYIGREHAGHAASKWENPFKIGVDGSRSECIAKYANMLSSTPALLRNIPQLMGKTLACWCAPNPCHGDVINGLIETWANSKIYAGIGSRTTPAKVVSFITRLARNLDQKSYVLRSGGADGADLAFQRGSTNSEIYLPFAGFNHNTSPLFDIPDEAFALAKSAHPAWGRLSDVAKKLHARNSQQVFGQNLDKPARLVICWTEDGSETEAETSINTGGTRTAIVLADRHGIPVINLAKSDALDRLTSFFVHKKIEAGPVQKELF